MKTKTLKTKLTVAIFLLGILLATTLVVMMTSRSTNVAHAHFEGVAIEETLSFEVQDNGTEFPTVKAIAFGDIESYSFEKSGLILVVNHIGNQLHLEIAVYEEFGQVLISVELQCGDYQVGRFWTYNADGLVFVSDKAQDVALFLGLDYLIENEMICEFEWEYRVGLFTSEYLVSTNSNSGEVFFAPMSATHNTVHFRLAIYNDLGTAVIGHLPIRYARVDIMRRGAFNPIFGSSPITTVRSGFTDGSGNFTYALQGGTSFGSGDFYRIATRTHTFSVGRIGTQQLPTVGVMVGLNEYFIETTRSTAGSTITVQGFNTNIYRGFYVMQGYVVGQRFVRAMTGSNINNSMAVVFPFPFAGTSGFAWNFLSGVGAGAWRNWQLLVHEYAHFVQFHLGFLGVSLWDYFFSGDRWFTGMNWNRWDDMLVTHSDKRHAKNLAWSEGWADAFSLIAQNYFASGYTIISDAGGSFIANLNMNSASSDNDSGQGQIRAITRVLWQIFTNSTISGYRNYQAWWNMTARAGTYTLTNFANVINAHYPQYRSRVGYILGRNQIAPRDVTVLNAANVSFSTAPQLRWRINGSYHNPNNRFRVAFYNSNNVLLHTTGNISSSTAFNQNFTHTVSSANWNQVVTNSNRTSTTYVSIQGFNTRTPVSGPFFSVKIPITAELGTIGLVFSGTTVTGFNGTATTVNIPEGVTAIGASAFAGNTNLSTITLPSTLQIIPNESFEGTPNLQSIEVGDGNNHFMSQSGILYRVWDDGGISFFHVPNRISGDIAIPNGVHTIPFYAFENRCLIRSVHISQNVSAISHNAFVGTRNLESITVQQNNRYFFVENGVLYRRNGWFVHLPEMFVRTAFLNAPMEVYNHFLNANHFRFIAPQTGYFRIDVLHRQWYSNFNVNDFTVFLQAGQTHYFYLRYNGNNINSRNSSQLIIREFLGNYTLHIEDGGGWIGGIVTGFTPLSNFDGHIIIPWNVTGIAENAFRNATNIRTITVESGGSHTITVGSYAFANSNVEEIFLPRNIGTPLRNAFLGANNLTINMARESAPNAAIWNPSNRPIRWGFVNLHGRHLYTPQGTLNSELMFFRYVGSSSEISIPRQTIGVGLPSRMVTAIYPNAFYGMARLSRVIVPDTIASIDDIYFPIWTNVHWVGRYEFRGNKFLRYLGKLPAGEIWSIAGRNITTIRDGAFLGFFGSELVIPVNIENIADNAFYGVEIEQITLPIAWSGIFGRMFGATTIQNHNDFLPLNLHTINLSYGTMLPDDSFAGLRTPPPIGHTLTVNLPSTLTSIGQRAFANNNRTWRIEIPRGVSNTTNAFETWGGLQRIYVRTNHNFILNSRTPAQVILLEEIDRPIVRPISTRIYFYARGFDWWIQPRAHAWTVETNRDLLGEWNTSSQNMTRECSNYSTNWWHIDVPVNVNEEAFYIIVYNGGHGHWGWNTTRCHYRTQHRITNFSQRYITWYYNQHGSLNWHRMHAEGYVAVFFYNRNGAWSQPRAHAWNWTKDLLGGWNTPRQNMTRECPNGTTNWWFINVPTTREFNIIIYNSSNPWYRAGQQFISPSPTSIFPRYISWRYYQEGFNSLSRGLAMH